MPKTPRLIQRGNLLLPVVVMSQTFETHLHKNLHRFLNFGFRISFIMTERSAGVILCPVQNFSGRNGEFFIMLDHFQNLQKH